MRKRIQTTTGAKIEVDTDHGGEIFLDIDITVPAAGALVLCKELEEAVSWIRQQRDDQQNNKKREEDRIQKSMRGIYWSAQP